MADKTFRDLGPVTAYAAAVEKGYFTGTEEEWLTMLSNVSEYASQAQESASEAAASATAAQESADTFTTDPTLTQSGKAADAKATGDAVDELKSAIDAKSGLSNEAKQALLACFENVAWINEDGQTYVDALEAALYPPANLVSISVVYTQSGTVYDTDTLDSLKADLVVTATYDNSTTQTITAYTLSGTLTEGTSTITVSYGGKTDTFTVVVTTALLYSLYNHTFSNDGAVIASPFLSSDRDITIAFDVDFAGQLSNETWKLFGMGESVSPYRGLVLQSWQKASNDMMIQNMADQKQIGTINFRSYIGNFKYIVTHSLGSDKWHYYYKIGASAVVDEEVTSQYVQIPNAMAIGGSSSGTQYFNGTVNKAEVYGRVLSSDKIAAFMG